MTGPTRIPTDIRRGTKITRAEWTRHRREFGIPSTGKPVFLVGLLGFASGLGWLAHAVGRDITAGQPFPDDLLGLAVSVAFLWMVWRSSKYTHVRFERLNPDLLLTTVPARTAMLGLLGFVYARLLTTLAVPTLGIAVGTAVGLRSPTSGLDPRAARTVRETITNLAAADTTVFLSTHILPVVEEIATDVGILYDGDIVADGPPGELTGDREIDGEHTLEDVFLEVTTEDEYPEDESMPD